MYTPINILNENGKFLVAIPHSGLDVPPYVRERDNLIVRPGFNNEIDRFSFEVFSTLLSLDGIIFSTDIHRYVVDLNRKRNNYSSTGVFRKEDFDGRPLLKRNWSSDEMRYIISSYYDPFYFAIINHLASLRSSKESVFLLSGHTMKPYGSLMQKDSGKRRPDFCIGTNNDTLADKGYIALFESALLFYAGKEHYTVTKDILFRAEEGIAKTFGCPDGGYHSLQLEINEELCEDEDERNTIERIVQTAIYEVVEKMG